jgi:hypothetical protein
MVDTNGHQACAWKTVKLKHITWTIHRKITATI